MPHSSAFLAEGWEAQCRLRHFREERKTDHGAKAKGRTTNYPFAYFSHFTISGRVGRLPYMRMPMR